LVSKGFDYGMNYNPIKEVVSKNNLGNQWHFFIKHLNISYFT
jgi:hypothetical protein